ncbi:MAG: hypothetical protein IJW51_07965 [Clostridia bacterium]|nr:hypothetical protein [Clostridia bacterium]
MRANHDVHTHNYLSECCGDNQATVESFIKQAKELDIKVLGFSNHTWDESVPLPQTASKFYKKQCMPYEMLIKRQIPEVEGLKILVGAETEYCGMYDVLGMDKEAALQLDYLLIPHSHVHMRNFVMPPTGDVLRARDNLTEIFSGVEGITAARARALADSMPEGELEPFMGEKQSDYIKHVSDFMVASFRGLLENEMLKSYSDLIPVSVAHPFQPVGSFGMRPAMQKLISDNTYGELFEGAAKRGIGLEINGAVEQEECYRMFGIAKECGCKFTIGSDAHTPPHMAKIFNNEKLTTALGITEYDMMDFVRV